MIKSGKILIPKTTPGVYPRVEILDETITVDGKCVVTPAELKSLSDTRGQMEFYCKIEEGKITIKGENRQLYDDTYVYFVLDTDGTGASGAEGASSLSELSDVALLDKQVGQVLTWDGEKWMNDTAAPTIQLLNDIEDVAISDPEFGQVLTLDYNEETTEWFWRNLSLPPAPSTSLNDLTDVNFIEPELGDVLQLLELEGEIQWRNAPLPPASVDKLEDVGDVEIVTEPSEGQILVYQTDETPGEGNWVVGTVSAKETDPVWTNYQDNTTSIRIGSGSNSSDGSIALGFNATVSTNEGDFNQIAIGRDSGAGGPESVTVGFNCNAQASYSIAIGSGAAADGVDGIAIGRMTYSGAGGAVAIGYNIQNMAQNTVSIGTNGVALLICDEPGTRVSIKNILNLQPITEAENTSPQAGDIYFDSTTNKHRGFDGTIWNDLY